MTRRSLISVFVAAPDVVAEGVGVVLRSTSQFVLAGSARTAEAAIRDIGELTIQICVVDAGLQHADEVCRATRTAGARAILFADTARQISGSGAILSKRIEQRPFGEALQTIARRGRLPHSAALPPRAPRLSVAHLRVIEHIVQGASSEEISRALGVSVHTAKSYLGEIYRRLGAANRAHAAALAIRIGLI